MTATAAFILLCASLVVQIVFLFLRGKAHDRFSHFPLLGATLLLFLTTVLRSVQIEFFAITNTFESLVFFSGVIALILFIYKLKAKRSVLPLVMFGGTVLSIILLAIASSPNIPKEALPPIPALRSHWLVLHVTFSFIGEAFFAFAFAASIYFLAAKDEEKKRVADRITYTSIGIGYPVFTAGALIFGAIWAQYAWGSYWSWDPKETWALVTWIVYTGYLHTRFIAKMKGKTSAILSIVGFCLTMFTFFGVNYLLSGLHSYG
jgi:ABC-type transport system involved in cytochrome c biogenesis permease subunit